MLHYFVTLRIRLKIIQTRKHSLEVASSTLGIFSFYVREL